MSSEIQRPTDARDIEEITPGWLTDVLGYEVVSFTRLGQLQATLLTTIGCIYATRERSDASDAMFLAMARRSSAAIRDLGTLDLL